MVLNVFSQIVGFIGSLCLLLFGMNMLSNGIQKELAAVFKNSWEKLPETDFMQYLQALVLQP